MKPSDVLNEKERSVRLSWVVDEEQTGFLVVTGGGKNAQTGGKMEMRVFSKDLQGIDGLLYSGALGRNLPVEADTAPEVCSLAASSNLDCLAWDTESGRGLFRLSWRKIAPEGQGYTSF